MDINRYPIYGGRMVAEDGSVVNIADAIGGENTGMKADINRYPVYGGRFVAEDGSVLNIAKNIGKGSGGKTDSDDTLTVVAAVSSGNINIYRATMRQWFRERLPDGWTATDLTALCDRWYTITRTGWSGYSEFYQPSVSAVSAGTKGGDNKDLVCIPSTDTETNRDDYAGLPLFAICDCNWVVDPDSLEPVITDIEGITSGFERYNSERYVGVLQMSPWHFWQDNADTYLHGIADYKVAGYEHVEPVPEAVRIDGSVRPWVVHAKYMSATKDDKMTCCAGMIPTAFTSHNSLHALSTKNGAQYSGGTTADDAWLKLMFFVKYASLTADAILQGCCNYNFQYPAAASETGIKRVLLTEAQANNLTVGSGVIVGNYNGTLDRGNADMYSITGSGGAKIAKIEKATVDGVQYSAVYIDTAATFDTVANGASKAGTTYISTWHWASGSCDSVNGADGSPGSNTNGKYPARIQGIEYAVGGYEVYADVIQNLADNVYTPQVVRRSVQQASSITKNYINVGINYPQPASDGWTYPKKLDYKNGVFYAVESGGSSSTYLRDGFYVNKAGTTGVREWLAFGNLGTGAAYGGLSCLYGGNGLSIGWWYSLARISPTGNRGEFSA